MTTPPFADYVTLSSTSDGLQAEDLEGRMLTCLSVIASGENPDGTAWPGGSGGSGGVASVTAGDSSITIGGTGTNPTVAISAADQALIASIGTTLFTTFTTITATPGSAAVAGQLFTVNTGTAATITLPTTPTAGQVVGVVRGTANNAITIVPPAGATIAGLSTCNISNTGNFAGQFAAFIATSSTTWEPLVMSGTDLNLGWAVKNNLTVGGVAKLTGGTDTHSSTGVTTPTFTSGTAAVANATNDSMVYIDVTLTGTLTVAIGPTSGAADVLYTSVAVTTATAFPSIYVPASWFLKITAVTATYTTTVVTL